MAGTDTHCAIVIAITAIRWFMKLGVATSYTLMSTIRTCMYNWFVNLNTEQAPTNLMVGQIGLNRVRVSWTPLSNPPSRGYLITIGDTRPTDFSAGITASSTASSHPVGQQPGRVTYWLVALNEPPIVVGSVSGTVRGEEMQIIMYNQ